MPISEPSVTITLTPANLSVSTGPQRVLVIGQMKTGSATAGSLVQDLGNANEWDALFGSNSMLAGALRAFRKLNKVTAVDVIPLADAGGGVAATGTIVFTGPTTASGTLFVTVGSYQNNRYELDLVSGQSATAVGAALAALINADVNCPVTASASTGTVTLTYDNAGVEGNYCNVRVEGAVTGLTFTVTGFASGATNPTLTNILALVSDTRYQTVVWPTSYATTEVLSNFLDLRFNVANDIQDGVCIQTQVDTKANLKTALLALNNKNLVQLMSKVVNDAFWKGNGHQELPFVLAAEFAALRSLRLTAGANIASYVTTTTGTLDTIGGPALASLPYFNTPMPYISLIPVGKDFSQLEVDDLSSAGGTCIGNNRARTGVVLGDAITTYKTDAAGNVDVTFKYLNNVDTSSAVREYFFNNLKKQYAQTRLTGGDLVPNRAIANDKSISGYADQLYTELASTDFVLLQRGEEALQFFKNNKTVVLNLAAGSATMNMKTPIVTQLRQLIVPMQIAFSTT